MEPGRVSTLAAIGFAARATSPALLHAVRGCLHDVTMLTALLQPPPVASPARPDAAQTTQRLHAINAQLESLGRNISLLGAMLQSPVAADASICTTANALPDVVRLLRDETARRRVRLEHDLDGLPPHIASEERALQRALLTCGAWLAEHAGEHGIVRLVGREEDSNAVFDFELHHGASLASLPRDELALLTALVEAANGTLSASPKLSMVFARATGHSAAAT